MFEKGMKEVLAMVFIGVIVLIIININLNKRLNNLDWSYGNLNAEYKQLHNDIQGISDRIDLISEHITQNAKLSFDESILIQKYNNSTLVADVEIAYFLKEHKTGETVTVTARNQSGQTYTAMAIRSDTGRFSANMTLPVYDNYVLTFTTGRETNRTGELMRLNLADRLVGYERFNLNYGYSYSYSTPDTQPSVIHFQPSFSNNTQGSDALTISKISLSLESDGEPVMAWDLLPYLQNSGNTQVLRLDESNSEAFWITIGTEPGQLQPSEKLVARLAISDNLGVNYERTDKVSISIGTFSGGGVGGIGGVGGVGGVSGVSGGGGSSEVFRIVDN